MPIPVTSNFVPREGQNYFLMEDTHLRGGFRVVKTVEQLVNLNPDSLKSGTQVYLVEGNINGEGVVDTSNYNGPLAGGRNYVYDIDQDDVVTWTHIGSTFRGYFDERVAYGYGDFVIDEMTGALYICIGPLEQNAPLDSEGWFRVPGDPSIYKGMWNLDGYDGPSMVFHQGEIFFAAFGTGETEPPNSTTMGSMNPWIRIGSAMRDVTFNTGMWDPTYKYVRGNIVRDPINMEFYINMSDAGPSENKPSQDSNWVRISSYDSWEGSGVRYRGDFQNSKKYTDGNLVWHNQKMWVCNNGGAPTSEEPTADSFLWQMVADSRVRSDITLTSVADNVANSTIAVAVVARDTNSLAAEHSTVVSIEGTDPQSLELYANDVLIAKININDGSDYGTVVWEGGQDTINLPRGTKLTLRTTATVSANNRIICAVIACWLSANFETGLGF